MIAMPGFYSWLAAARQHFQTRGEEAATRFNPDTRLGRAAQSGTVMTVVTLGIVALIGILVFSEVNDALGDIGSTNESKSNYSELAGPQDSLVTGFGNSMELVPVVLIVLIAAVVLGVVQRMR